MNICIKIRAEGRKETAMWMSVDRIEDMTVILLDDEEKTHPLPADRYRALTGLPPRESDVLEVTLDGDLILTAVYSESETKRREEAARKRLNRLFGRK
jgi:hypothetical protein